MVNLFANDPLPFTPAFVSKAALTAAGPQLDVPHDVTPQQLETLLNGLLKQEEKLPYSFFVNEQQISDELGAHLLKNKV